VLRRVAPSWRRTLALAGLLALVAAGLGVGLGYAAGPSFAIYGNPHAPAVPAWLTTPLAGLAPAPGEGTFTVLVLVMFASYLVVVTLAEFVGARWGIAAILVLHAGLLLAPPILSGDVFAYLAYARLDLLQGLDPYREAADATPHDPLFPFVGMKHIVSPYGPLFTLLTWGLVPLGVVGGVWALKASAVLASLAGAGLVWSCARALGRDPLAPTLFVALNPIQLVYGVGGAHNDLLMAVLVLAGVRLALANRDSPAGAVLAAATAVKATAGLVLPFLVLGSRRPGRTLAVSAASSVLLAAAAVGVFGAAGMAGYLKVLIAQGGFVSKYSVWALLAGDPATERVPDALKAALLVAFTGATGALLVRTWRGGDWIGGAGWAVLALLLATTWLLPWYIALLLPLVALGGSAPLRNATHAFTALVLLTRLPLLLA
jgi:alpha-1,6-mannosyltransferase